MNQRSAGNPALLSASTPHNHQTRHLEPTARGFSISKIQEVHHSRMLYSPSPISPTPYTIITPPSSLVTPMAYLSDTEIEQPHPATSSRTARHPPECYPSPLPNTMHVTLPAPDSKYTPKTFYGDPLELHRFLDYFRRTCLHHNITSSEDKYQGILQYCSDKVLTTPQSLDSSLIQD